jgi:type I restriction enzyme S subunit
MRPTWAGAHCRYPEVAFRRIFEQLRRPVKSDAQIVTAYTNGEVTLRRNRRLEGYHEAADLSGFQGVEPGDFVVHGLDILRGSIGVSDSSGAISSVCIVCQPRAGDDQRFFAYAMRAQAFSGFPRAMARGVREGGADFRRWDTLAELPLPKPTPAQQRAIADFLDVETARIEALITKKRRLAALLYERMEARVRELTRRGLDASVELRDSGLPWVGQIPAHWQVVPARSVLQMRRELVGPAHENVLLLSLTRRGVIVRDVSENHGKFPSSFDTYQHVSPGELVFCLFDIPETPRTVGLVRDAGMVTGAYTVFRAYDASAAYISFLYEGFDNEKSLSLWYTGLRNVIRPETFLSIRIPLPPRDEQDAIAATLARERRRVDDLVSRLQEQTALLEEHRQALITAAVTGELEVPGVAA